MITETSCRVCLSTTKKEKHIINDDDEAEASGTPTTGQKQGCSATESQAGDVT